MVESLSLGKSVDSAEFRGLMAMVPTSVAVVAGLVDGVPVGLTVGTFVSVSLDPLLASICVARTSRSWPRIRPSGRFSVSVLGESQHGVCDAFSSRDDDKFRGIDWSVSNLGLPRIAGSVAYLDLEVEKEIEAGDHVLVVGRVLALSPGAHEMPLVFHRRALAGVRHEP